MQYFSGPAVVALTLAAGLPAQGAQWQAVAAAGQQPDVVHAAMASDPLRGRIVLFGENAATAAPQTWEWNGAAWQAMAPATQPPVRDRGAMAFDPVRGRILLTGGTTTTAPFLGISDAWEWDGAVWQQLPAVANRPVASTHQVTTDFGGGRVLFMDAYGSLRVWNGPTWQVLGSTAPGYQSGMASTAAWDDARGRLVIQLYGFDMQYPPPFYIPTIINRWRVFEWDGTFHQISALPGGAALNYASPMFFDAERRRVGVLHLSDWLSPVRTWEWSGSWYLAGQQAPSWQAYDWRPLVAYDHASGATMWYDASTPPGPLPRFFRFVSSTPATVASHGAGCAGGLGIPVLSALPYSRPWIGDDFAVSMNNVPTGSFPLVVVGLAATSVGLGGLGMPACQLLVTPDLIVDMLPAPGQQATWSLLVPSVPALAGAILHLQGAMLLAGGAGPLGGATSQRLTATVGVR